jgi:RNA polymerase sigma-70 factor (ECF subfamily)
VSISVSLSDNEIVKLVQQGKTELFDVLIKRHQARMRGMVAHYVANHEDSFDIVQDAFLEAFIYIQTFDLELVFLPWLRSICRHRMIDHLRQADARHRVIQALMEQKDMQESRAQLDAELEKVMALKKCFSKLGPSYQKVIQLRYEAKVAVKDIAHDLGQTAMSVSSLLYRIRVSISKCIRKELARSTAHE